MLPCEGRPLTQVNVFLNTEAEVAHFAEVSLVQFVFFHFEAFLEDFLGLLAAHGAEDADLFVTTNAERAHGVARLGEHGRLAGELFEHFRGTGETIARLAHANVQAQLSDAQVSHDVLGLVFLDDATCCRRRCACLGGRRSGLGCGGCRRRSWSLSTGHDYLFRAKIVSICKKRIDKKVANHIE